MTTSDWLTFLLPIVGFGLILGGGLLSYWIDKRKEGDHQHDRRSEGEAEQVDILADRAAERRLQHLARHHSISPRAMLSQLLADAEARTFSNGLNDQQPT